MPNGLTEFEMSIDDFCEQIFGHLGRHQDGGRGHWASYYTENKELAVDRALLLIRPLVAELMRKREIEES